MIAQPYKNLNIEKWSNICEVDICTILTSLWEVHSGKRFIWCTLSILYSTYGRSVYSLYIRPRWYIYLGTLHLGKYAASGCMCQLIIDLLTVLYVLHIN